MLLKFLFALLGLQLLDLYLLFSLGRSIGFWQTLILVIGMGFVGSSLARREGLRVWRGWQAALQGQHLPEEGIVDGMLVLLGGGLLILPGLVTDVVGLALLVPVSRRLIARALRGRLEVELQRRSVALGELTRLHPLRGSGGERGSGAGEVIDTTGVESRERLGAPPRLDSPSPLRDRPTKHSR